MSNFRNFAITGAGKVGSFIVEELLKQKAAGAIDEITIVSRPVRHVAQSFRLQPERQLIRHNHTQRRTPAIKTKISHSLRVAYA